MRPALGAAYHHVALGRHPRVLCNSIPKAGTNLLIDLVLTLPRLRTHGRGATWNQVPRALVDESARPTPTSILEDLAVCLPGEVYLGHLEAEAAIVDFVAERFRTLFIYRDPRDVVVSLFHWWNRDPATTWPEPDTWPLRYFQSCETDDDKIAFLIDGWPDQPGPDFPARVDFPDIGRRVSVFLPWLDVPEVWSVRFEDLRAHGRSPDLYHGLVRHLYPAASESRIATLARRMSDRRDPSRSKTFRSGRSGGWRDQFTGRHVESMKQHAGQLLVDLGYESGLDWS
jgi:hypothetical protein